MRNMEEVVGYGFRPTNEQLIGHYLRKKRLNPDYSNPNIREITICDHEPSELLGDAQERYFFVAPRYTNAKRKLVKRKTRGGTWKATGKKPDVKDKRSKEVLGIKSKLVFYQGPSTRNKNARTNYVMDELHCKDDPLFKAEFVVVRIKIKPNDSCESSTTSESVISHQLTSDSGDHNAEVSQVESEQLPNNYMSCNGEDYSVDIIFSKEFQPLQNPDISLNRISQSLSQSLSNHVISPNMISQPLSNHYISLNREPDLLSNHDISSNGESLTLSNHDISFNRENQPQPDNDIPLPNNSLCSIIPHHGTSFNREVQPIPNDNLSSILPHHEISSNREFQPLNYDISFNRDYQPVLHDNSSNRESHVVQNYNLSSILPPHDISSNRESHPPPNHSLYPNIGDLVTENTSSEVEPLVPAVWDSPIEYNGQDHYSFSTQQKQTHLQQMLQVWDSLIDCNGQDQNFFSAEQMQNHLQQGSSHSCDLSSDSNVLIMPLGSAQENNWSNLQRDVQDEFSEKETRTLSYSRFLLNKASHRSS
ncbi:hypothetical protein Dsin_005707 [Dipteronia sinensis]|uniref:NAC domain-containing protein n=1 Tax=Dipteronia sinensis TaxID=43782 RepID=A0AAE0AXT9_9ROSI|nr:hypothetical protein Dsin_005707 [Dipteronia sinensis]